MLSKVNNDVTAYRKHKRLMITIMAVNFVPIVRVSSVCNAEYF